MKANRVFKLRKMDDSGSIGTYVLIMFGIIVTLYMFGYTNTLDLYLQDSKDDNINITDTEMQKKETMNPMSLFLTALINLIKENPLIVGVGVGALVLASFIGYATGSLSVVYTYLIPIVIIALVLNLFIFPLTSIDAELRTFMIWDIPLSWIIIMFLNLMYILAVLEYVRTGTTT